MLYQLLMEGLITTRHLLLCAHEIISEFGFETYWRCIKSAFGKRRCTFLEVVFTKA